MEITTKSNVNIVPDSVVVVVSKAKIATTKPEILLPDFAQHVNRSDIIELEPNAKVPEPNLYKKIDEMLQQGGIKKLKEILRKQNWNLFSPIRSKLWPQLCAQHSAMHNLQTGFYQEMVEYIFGMTEPNGIDATQQVTVPLYVDARQHLSYHLTNEGIISTNRILNVLDYENPVISYCPELYPLTAIFLHYMNEDVACYSIARLLNSTGKVFINTTKLMNEITAQMVLQMSRRYAKPVLHMLHDLCPKANLEQVFMQWNWWIFAGLPFSHLVRIIDCFLFEGIKVFYRITFVLLNLFAKEWPTVDGVFDDLMKNDVSSALIKFYQHVPMSPAKLLAAGFSIRSFSGNYIAKQFAIADKIVRARQEPPLDEGNANNSQFNLLSISHSLVLRDQVHAHTWQKMLFTLWTWMPIRISMSQPNPLYSTSSHKRDLSQIYDCMCKHAPALLIIETCTNEIFGFYNSTCLTEPDAMCDKGFLPICKGIKEDFLFVLHPKRMKYPCNDIHRQPEPSYLHKHFDRAAAIELNTQDERRFIGEAIWLDENLQYGKSKFCKMYNSPSLCPRGEFEILLLQIFNFNEIDPKVLCNYTEQTDL